jgi:hypothetical protein
MGQEHIHNENIEFHNHVSEYDWGHTHQLDPENKIHFHHRNLQANIEKYMDEVLSHEKEDLWKELTYDSAKDMIVNKKINNLTDDQVRALIIYTTFTYCVNNMQEAEMMFMSELAVKELKGAGLLEPVSNMFINSLFNFRNVYRPLYDLLDLVSSERVEDENRLSDEYRLGVIDSILALRRYERSSGFGFEDPNPRFNVVAKDQINDLDKDVV